MVTLSSILYAKHKEPIIGMSFTKHFFERLEERKKLDSFKSILSLLNKNLCIIIYELSMIETSSKIYTINGANIPLILVNTDYPKIIVKTIY